MAKMTDWLAHHTTRAITTKSSLVPKLYVSQSAPSTADLAAVAQKETADGWPSNIVTRNSTRRAQRFDLFVTNKGFTIGDRPIFDICPEMESGIKAVKRPRGLKFVRMNDSRDVERMKQIGRTWFETPGAVADFIQDRLIGQNLAVASVILYTNNQDYAYGYDPQVEGAISAACEADDSDEFLYVGVKVWLGYYSPIKTDGAGVAIRAVIKFVKAGAMKGVRGMMFMPTDRASAWLYAADPDRRGWALTQLWADRGMEEYIPLYRSDVIVRTVTNAPSDSGWANQAQTDSSMGTLSFHPCGVNSATPVSWWNGTRTRFEERLGIWKQRVYAIGNPEFVNRFAALGQWLTPPNETTIALDGAELCFDWTGQRLADMNPKMSLTDKEAVSKLFITTAISDVASSTACSLSDLYVESLYQQQGMTVADEVFKKSEVRNGVTYPAMTFQEAVAATKTVDTKIWHRIEHSDTSAFDVDRVAAVGKGSDVVVTSYDGAQAVSTDVNFALAALLSGAELDTYGWVPGLVTDIGTVVWGFTLNNLAGNKDKLAMRADFDEGTAYGRGAPFLRKTSGSVRTGMLMTNAAMARQQFSSFVVGAAVMASNARKVLT